MKEAYVTPGYLKRKFPNNPAMHAVIDFIKKDGVSIPDTSITIAQTAHGFVVGDAIKITAAGWVKAKADSRANAGTVGFVSQVVDANNFKYIESGILPGEYIPAAIYLLSTATAGAIAAQTDPETFAIGQVREVVGVANSTGTALIVGIQEGQVISSVLLEPNIVTSGSVANKVMTIKQSGGNDVNINLPDYQLVNDVLTKISALTSGTGLLRKTATGWELDNSTGWNNTVQQLAGTSVTLNPDSGLNAKITLTAYTTITLVNLQEGMSGNIFVQNGIDQTILTFAGYTVYVSNAVYNAASKVRTSGGNRRDRFSWVYDGATVSINGQLDYK